MIKLPPNCRLTYTDNGVKVRMTYSTVLPVGIHEGLEVFQGRDYYTKKGKFMRGKRYLVLEFDVATQYNLNKMFIAIRQTYYEFKQKAMIFNRIKKQDKIGKEVQVLSKSMFPGTWDILYLKDDNQMPPPPNQITFKF